MQGLHHIIVAAGSGSRYGGSLPKQFLLLEERPVVMHAIDALERLGGHITVVISKPMRPLWDTLSASYSHAPVDIVYGGETRWHSVRNALDSLPADAHIVTVHDAARPLPCPAAMKKMIEAVGSGAATAAIPVGDVTDTIRLVSADDGTSTTLDRARLRSVRTPQVFDAAALRQAYALPRRDSFTDDASVMEAAGWGSPLLVDDWPLNIKITRPGDLEIAAGYLAMSRQQK